MITRRALPALAPASRIGCRIGYRTFLSNIVPPEVQTYHIKKVLNYPPELMYSVVSDVASYSSFVPYCLESTITARDESRTPTAATLRVGWKDLDESFESQLSFTPTSVEAGASHHHLFKTLSTKWSILPAPGRNTGKCAVDFSLQYSFRNPLYNAVSHSFGPTVTKMMVKAFTDRADQLMAERTSQPSRFD